jgi:primosomal protein N' (replication factor Y)
MKIVTVIPLKKGGWKEDLTYFTAKEIRVGSVVTVPFRTKNILGLVTSSEDASETKRNIKDLSFNLKKIVDVKDDFIFTKEFLDSALETCKYFAVNKNGGLASLIPIIFIERYDKLVKVKKEENLVEKKEVDIQNKLKSEKLLLQLPFTDRISIYKTLIRENFALKKSVFIVLPTEQDIKIFLDVLSKGVEQFTFVIHSGISPKKTLSVLEKIISSSHPLLIIGTAPNLIIPRKDLGVIILEHESSSAYKTIARPQLDLRIFVELFASKINAKFILADTLLRFDTIARKDIDDLHPMHPISFRVDFEGEIEILNTKKNKENKFTIIPTETIEEIQKTLEKQKNVFIFSLRKGLSTMTVCYDCHNMLTCKVCGAPVVLYKSKDGDKRLLACNRCRTEVDADTSCENCGSWNLVPLGIGTDTVFEYLREEIGRKVKIFKLDKESVKSAKDAEEIIREFESSEGAILVGTEMAFFYMRNKVFLSVVASFDSLWSIPNFKMSERVLQLVVSMTDKTESKLIIQTKNENDPALLALKSGNLLSFVRQELEDRQALGYPPFKRFIKISYLGDKIKTQKTKEALAEVFKEYQPEIFSGFHAKWKDKYVTNALIKLDPKHWSFGDLAINTKIDENLYNKLISLPPAFQVSIDPEDLL